VIVGTWRAARDQGDGLAEADIREALLVLDPVWDELFPTEQARVLQLLIERVVVYPDRLDLRFRVDGLQSLVADIIARRRAA
jgi:site-specific DNA recombinase